MLSELLKYLSVYFTSMLKFMAGPPLGVAVGFSSMETILICILGMMTSVVTFTLVGEKIKPGWLPKFFRKFREKNTTDKRFNYIWTRFGIFGVTFLTPVLFTPIGGTLLVSAMGSPRLKIIGYMFLSAVFWAVALSKLSQIIIG